MSRRNHRGGRPGVRTERVASTLREVISEELNRIGDDTVAYVTVTDVEVDAELTLAKVNMSTLDLVDEDLDGVREHTPRIRKAIAQRANIRRVPILQFMVDPGLQAGTRVEELLRSMTDDRAFGDAPDGPAGDGAGEPMPPSGQR